MQYVTIKCENFIGNMIPLKGSKAVSILAGIFMVIPWRID